MLSPRSQDGDITYHASNLGVYPPTTTPIAEAMHTGWGGDCGNVAWEGTPACVPGVEGVCPSPQTACLPLDGWNRSSSGAIEVSAAKPRGAMARHRRSCS